MAGLVCTLGQCSGISEPSSGRSTHCTTCRRTSSTQHPARYAEWDYHYDHILHSQSPADGMGRAVDHWRVISKGGGCDDGGLHRHGRSWHHATFAYSTCREHPSCLPLGLESVAFFYILPLSLLLFFFFKRRQGEAIDGESHFSPPYLLIASLCCLAAPDRNTIQPMSYFKNTQQSPHLSVSEPLAQRSLQSGRCYLNASGDFKEREK